MEPTTTTDRSASPGFTGHRPLSRRGVVIATLVALVLSFLQSPGLVAADTKLDLTANPLGFLARAAHLWTPVAPMGQVQNQAYGYFFPHGAFFALGEMAHLPPWVTQRLWWALLLVVGFVGLVRLAEAMRIGSPASRIIAAAIFVLSPRVLTTMGSISSETLPMMLAPWVLLPVVRALSPVPDPDPDAAPAAPAKPLWRNAFLSAAAVALMGAVNAVATVAAVGVAVLWWAMHLRAGRTWRFGGWWALGLAMACAWWIAPLLILSRVSPPFLDFIESSRVTTQWTSLTEVLRGTSSWTPFVSPERVAGAVLVTQPAAVLATGVLVAAGLAGLAMRHMPFRGRLITVLVVGLVIMCVGYAGALGSPIAEHVRVFLDGAGAPLRNIHKFEPFIRIPAVLGVAHLLARVPLPPTVPIRESLAAFAHPQRSRPVAAAIVVLVAIVGAGSLMWTGQLTPADSYRDIPGYWKQTADWLAAQDENPDRPAGRTLVVPGAPFADQLWGLTRDEPLQPLAQTPWAVRDAIPLTPPGAIRALDSVQREIAAGRGSPGLAETLAQQGISTVVLRADLDPDTSRSARPLLAQQALGASPGLTRAAEFGPEIGPSTVAGVVRDNGLRPPMRAITIYRVIPGSGATGDTGPILTDLSSMPRVIGGPEALASINAQRAQAGQPTLGPTLLDADATRAGLTVTESGSTGPVIVTDTPADREIDFGRVDDHSSAIRSPDDPRRTQNAVADYPVEGASPVTAQWLVDNEPGQVRVSSSGSASDATQPGQTSPANSTAAAFDGDPDTAWVSGGLESAVSRWLRVDFTEPRSDLSVTLTTAKAIGSDVSSILVTTDAGSAVAQGVEPGEPITVSLPSGPTRSVTIRAIETADRTAGNQFALADVAITDLRTGATLPIRQRIVLPQLDAATSVSEWVLGQELSGRSSCVETSADPTVRCAPGLGLAPESPGVFTRVLSVPQPLTATPTVTLRPQPGDGLRALLFRAGEIQADGPSGVTDPRGSAQAAVDGDPRTTWTAPENTSTDKTDEDSSVTSGARGPVEGDPADVEQRGDRDDANADEQAEKKDAAEKEATRDPELTLRLPQAQRVEQLALTVPTDYPAAPTKVAVDLGTGRQERTVPADGIITLYPATTDRITLTVLHTTDVIDVNALGFARPAPAGISEIAVLPTPTGATRTTAADDAPVTIGCDAGIGITVSGQVIRLSATTTRAALRSGSPIVARPCDDATIGLGAGEQELSVNPGNAFSVDSVDLRATAAPLAPATAISQPTVDTWQSTFRQVSVGPSSTERVLSVPESTNSGWRASIDTSTGTTDLTPIAVDGWQQGWIIPTGVDGTVTMRYALDSVYRWCIGIGLVVLALLLALAWLPLHHLPLRLLPAAWLRSPVDIEAIAPIRAPALALVGWLGASWLLAGWWGVGIAIGGAVVTGWVGARIGVVVTCVAMLAATVGLATGPWHSATGYVGDEWWVQVPALIAVSTLVSSSVIPALRASRRWALRASRRCALRASLRRNQRRAGSSTNA